MSFAGNCCPECKEPMSAVYLLDNILGTKDRVRNCTSNECDYWEAIVDEEGLDIKSSNGE